MPYDEPMLLKTVELPADVPRSLREMEINPALPEGKQTMYAVVFDLDTEMLSQTYGSTSPQNAYGDIKKFMLENGFEWKQGSVYYGDPERINAATCVTTIQRLAMANPWFSASVRDIRMLRIEENDDLRPAIELVSGRTSAR